MNHAPQPPYGPQQQPQQQPPQQAAPVQPGGVPWQRTPMPGQIPAGQGPAAGQRPIPGQMPPVAGQPAPMPMRQPVQTPVYTGQPYQTPMRPPIRPMVARPPAAPMARKLVKKKSAAPWFLAVAWWLAYAVFFSFRSPADFLLAAGGSAIIFLLSRLLIRDKEKYVPMTPSELRQMEEEQRRKAAEAQAAKQAAEDKSAVIPAQAREYLRQMRSADVAIEDEAVSAKIRILETRTDQIFRAVAEDPDKLPAIRRFMDYYLPTLLKLLRSYDHMEEQGIQGENIRRTMREIEGVLDTVVQAFDKQLDKLFQDEAMDISSDIKVLENMLSQEGLLQSDFGKPPEK